MLIGGHVSPAGGPANAVLRGEERACRAIQFFNQSPRAWRPRVYSEEEVAAYHEAISGSPVDALLIHAVYLLNCASEDEEIRGKSLTALTHALNAGAALGATGVVLHPGSALKNGGSVEKAIERAGAVIAEALEESAEGGILHLEDTAGAGGTLGRSFEELAALIEAAGGGNRVGICLDSCHLLASGYDIRTAEGLSDVLDRFDEVVGLDSCHLLASGYDIRTAEGLSDVLDRFDEVVGLDRLGSLHVNDSMTPLGSNRDRHINLGEGEIGADGIAAFLSEPRFDGLPVIFEGPGHAGKAVERADIENALALRERGLKARGA